MEKEFVLAPDLVILSRSDLTGKITGYNEGFREASGYTDVDLLGASHNLLRHPDVPKAVFQDYWQTIQAGYTWSGVIKNRRKDGDYYWVFAHVTPIVEEGKTTGYMSVRYPATRRQILDAQALYRDLTMGKHVFIKPQAVVFTKQDIGLALVSAITPLALGLQGMIMGSWLLGGLGVLSAGISIYAIRQIIKARSPTLKQQAAINAISNGNFCDRLTENDHWSIALNGMRARLAEFSAMRYDAKKLLQQRADALAESSRYKSEFLANMGHELRTPLNSINVLAGLLAQNGLGNLSQQQIEQLQVIHYAGRDLLDLINDLLDFSNMESGRMSVKLEWVDICNLTKEMFNLFSPLLDEKDITSFLIIEMELPKLYTDAAKVRQMIKHLMSNALKFTEAGCVTLEVLPSKHHLFALEIRVHDTGCGIPMDKQEEIFESFCQADGTTSRKYGGTGLGLSICRQVAQCLGGKVIVNSRPDEGSTFSLLLPLVVSTDQLQEQSFDVIEIPAATSAPNDTTLASAEHNISATLMDDERLFASMFRQMSPAIQASAELVCLAGREVLVVDQDMRHLYALRALLETNGMKVVMASSGREALDILQQDVFVQALITDIAIPEVSGYELIALVREQPQWEKLPIIALTSRLRVQERELCISIGADHYLAKPVDEAMLLTLLRGLIAQQHPITQTQHLVFDADHTF